MSSSDPKAEAWVAKMNAEASAKAVRGSFFCLDLELQKHPGGGFPGFFCFKAYVLFKGSIFKGKE